MIQLQQQQKEEGGGGEEGAEATTAAAGGGRAGREVKSLGCSSWCGSATTTRPTPCHCLSSSTGRQTLNPTPCTLLKPCLRPSRPSCAPPTAPLPTCLTCSRHEFDAEDVCPVSCWVAAGRAAAALQVPQAQPGVIRATRKQGACMARGRGGVGHQRGRRGNRRAAEENHSHHRVLCWYIVVKHQACSLAGVNTK